MPATTCPADPPRLTRKGQATHDRILDAAAQLMYERGVAATSIDDVKAAAEVSSSQLYHYFAGKRELVTAVIAHQTEQVLGFQEPLLAAVDDREGLRAWRDAVVEMTERYGGGNGCPIGSLATELSDHDDTHHTALTDAFARWEDSIRAGLQRMRARGELTATTNDSELALALLTALQGGLLLSGLRHSADPLRAGLDAVIAHITAS